MPTILVAEDEKALQQMLQYAVRTLLGWAVRVVDTGEALLEAVATRPPSLIVLDVNLPGLSGIDTYRQLRQRDETRMVPVLFLTVIPQAVTQARLAGPYECLAKPFDSQVLLERLVRLAQ